MLMLLLHNFFESMLESFTIIDVT